MRDQVDVATKRRSAERATDDARGIADRFREVADRITRLTGTPWAMALAALVVVVWVATGPVFAFSDT